MIRAPLSERAVRAPEIFELERAVADRGEPRVPARDLAFGIVMSALLRPIATEPFEIWYVWPRPGPLTHTSDARMIPRFVDSESTTMLVSVSAWIDEMISP